MTETSQKIDNQLLKRVKQIGKFIGNTPLFPLNHIFQKEGVSIFAKFEWQQLGGSVKARPAFNIIKQAIKNGDLHKGKRLLDATSGNTGIAYATVGAAVGIPVTIVIPENASEERKLILKSLGAELIYTSKFDATDGSQAKAKELFAERPDLYYYADQYANDANWQAHYHTTANEILSQTQGSLTHFVTGLGTTGTFVGTTRGLKDLNPTIQVISLQPETALHGLEGWKDLETARVPKIYDPTLADQKLHVTTGESYELIKRVAKAEGLLLSPSAAANLSGAMQVANEIDEGVVVTVFADNAEKYGEVLKQLF